MRLPSALRALTDLVAQPPSPAPRRPLPAPEELAALDVNGFLHRLDANLHAITNDSTLDALLPPDAARRIADPRFAHADELFRSTLRGALVATSFRDLPEAARVHPAVQDRMWSAMDEIDSSVRSIADTLASLTRAERAEITRALREQPELGDSIVRALESEAERAGVSDERRAHLRTMGEHACFRLRQSASGFIDEYTAKIRKVPERSLPEAERYLAAQLGEPAFAREKEWHLAVHQAWQSVLADNNRLLAAADGGASGGIDADDAYAPPADGGMPPPPPARAALIDPNRGKTVLKVGAWLFGIGVLCVPTGGMLVSTHVDGAVVAGLISFTAAAVLGFVGLVCLIVGAILRLVTRSELRAADPDLLP